ncbi:HEAT repeat containing 9 [Rhinolophus ferrumequinum]|uniref:HEAT repeat containing 9 n=1 Tax=Rhinolophus ferrumequinum TaxID=59479 RepID=A0A7J7TDQ6_RHIFE|nr:protein HEATR9 [Rhinolophus ferrumequinum]KAF6298675.1 HEAT repeat containing 9 [Rhinolophus ferrumequinum]
MDYKPSVDISDISRSMLKYPWLEYPGRNKELRKASAPVYLSLSCHQIPKEEFPPSPECWRQHPSKPNAIPYCYFKKPELYTHRHTLYDQRQEWEAQKMLQRMRDHPRHLKEDTPIQKVHLPKIKLTIKSQATSKPLHPIGDPPKWLRLKELTNSLNSPREDEQFYAAQALGCLGIGDKFVIEALLQVAQTGPEKVKSEACRTLAILGCLNKHVIQSVIKQLTGQNEKQRMDTLMGLRVALNSWAAVPKDKRTPVGDEEKLVPVLQLLIQKSLRATAMEAALCLGFLRPCSNTARQFLLQGLCQGPMTQRMKALRMLVTVMRVHSAAVIKATLDQLCRSSVMEHRFEATQMLKSIGLEQIQAHGLEGLLFDLLREKIYNEPFPAVRHAVAETVEEFKMKPTMMNLVEEQLMNSNAIARQQAVVSLGALGIRSPQVFHLLLDMLDEEKNQSVKKTLQETLLLLASIDPWIQKKLKNKALLVYEAPKTKKAEPTRFQNKPENSEELNIQDFRLAQLNPFLIAKASASLDQQKMLNAQKGSACYLTKAFPSCFSKPLGHNSPATGSWAPGIRKPFQILAQTPK